MFRKYVWICGAVICLGTAVTACGKGPGTDGGDRLDGTVSTVSTAVPETSGLAVSAAEPGLAEGTAVTDPADAEQAVEETVEFYGEYYLKSEISEETLKWLEMYQSMPEEDRQFLSYVPHEFVKSMKPGVAMETAANSAAGGTAKSVNVAAAGGTAKGGDTAAAGEPVPAVDILLTSAPELTLVDPLSSTLNRFVIQSGNFEWNVMVDGEVQSMVACGSHPLDAVMEQADRLKVPKYQRMDEVVYMLGCTVPPDRLTLVRWDASALGDVEAEAEETRTYEGDTSIDLKPGKVYEISAVWDHEKLEERGFSGTALYGFVTE